MRLYPLYHPAAALYTPRMLETLREDFSGIPALLAADSLPQPLPDEELEAVRGAVLDEASAADRASPPAAPPEASAPDQLGLF